MGYRVELTDAAERDLVNIVQYIAAQGLSERALHVLEAIEAAVYGLEAAPNRGSYPKELAAVGIRDVREVSFKPYRIIYRVFEEEQAVRVYLIADGRRSLQRLLERRLFAA